jgi:hypothetical protein
VRPHGEHVSALALLASVLNTELVRCEFNTLVHINSNDFHTGKLLSLVCDYVHLHLRFIRAVWFGRESATMLTFASEFARPSLHVHVSTR